MKAWLSAILVLVWSGAAYAMSGIGAARWAMGVVIPYAALLIFLGGLAFRVVKWAAAPVPFRIPTTCGQQKSLPWIKPSRIENPHTRAGAFLRVSSEVLLFRSLFRNTRAQLHQGPKLLYAEDKFLWLGAMAFHWSLLVILLRHLRFFLEPVPRFVVALESVDGFFQVSAPGFLITDAIILAALVFLLQRRFSNPQVRYISLFTDFLALFLLLAIAVSGIVMRYYERVDLESVKQVAIGLVTFSPRIPSGIGAMFFVHLGLVSLFLAYFPFSKLVHMGGIFLSPTRNLANNSRMRRHLNPWDYPVKVHTYAEWESEFHDKIKAAGLPLEKD